MARGGRAAPSRSGGRIYGFLAQPEGDAPYSRRFVQHLRGFLRVLGKRRVHLDEGGLSPAQVIWRRQNGRQQKQALAPPVVAGVEQALEDFHFPPSSARQAAMPMSRARR